jgi:hypothetical protein
MIDAIPQLSELKTILRDEMINVQFGALELKNNQMIIKDQNGVNIAIFNLFDSLGNPTMTTVYRREIV